MTDFERRALLGDKQAQEECTRSGIVLPCPFCGSHKIRTSNWGMWRCWCTECLCKSDDELRERDAIKKWNTRPAPPIGRCKDCASWRGNQNDADAPCKDCDGVMEADNFCKNFGPKENANEH